MGIRRKAFIIVSLSTIFLTIGMYTIFHFFFLHNIKMEEKEIMENDTNRVNYLLKREISRLTFFSNDWSHWTETFEFVDNLNQNYIDLNLNKATLANNGVNVLIYLDKEGEIKYSLGYDKEKDKLVPISKSLQEYLAENKKLFSNYKKVDSVTSGIVSLAEGPLLLAAGPITDSEYNQPIAGTLVVGNYLDASLLEGINQVTQARVQLIPINNLDHLPNNLLLNEVSFAKGFAEKKVVVLPQSSKTLLGYSLLQGLEGDPLFFIQIAKERTTYQQEIEALRFFTILFLIFTLLVHSIGLIFLQKTIIAPIVNLSKKISNLDLSSNSFSHLLFNGQDEIANLAREINKMLTRIKYLSYNDKLTGLFNRAYFEDRLEKMNLTAEPPLSIIIGDINGLKMTNDTFGHEEGDRLIIAIADILRQSCREDDLIARWGGDEFAIILPEADEHLTQKICETIKQGCLAAKTSLFTLNIALGYSTKTASSQDLKEIVREAEERMYRNKLFEGQSVRNSVMLSLEKTLAERSHETEEHTKRMHDQCLKIAQKLDLSNAKTDELALLASLHDIGKIAIADNILNKPGKLDQQEWAIMQTHSEIGYRIAAANPELNHIAPEILAHHENYDGTGYPKGLCGREIPLLARIIRIVDSYDVMTNERPYKKAMSQAEAIEELKRCSGTQFDPDLVNICIEVFQEEEKPFRPKA